MILKRGFFVKMVLVALLLMAGCNDDNVNETVTTDAVKPEVSITSPAAWQEFDTTMVTVSALVTNSATVEGITFFIDGDSVITLSNYPYSVELELDSAGSHTVIARGGNATGVGYSQLITFSVIQQETADSTNSEPPAPPYLTSPAAWQEFDTTLVPLGAVVTNDEEVEGITFYVDGDSVMTLYNYPYEFEFQLESKGTHTLIAKAYNEYGGSYSELITFSVVTENGGDSLYFAPLPYITKPAQWQEFNDLNVPFSFMINNLQYFNYLAVFIDGDSVAALYNSPFSYQHNFSDAGTHTAMAKAVDIAGNYYYSSLITYNIIGADSKSPTAVITFPANYHLAAGTQLTVKVAAADDKAVQRVELLVDGESTAVLNNAPFNFDIDITGYTSGDHTFLAVAYDEAGNTGLSQLINITIP